MPHLTTKPGDKVYLAAARHLATLQGYHQTLDDDAFVEHTSTTAAEPWLRTIVDATWRQATNNADPGGLPTGTTDEYAVRVIDLYGNSRYQFGNDPTDASHARFIATCINTHLDGLGERERALQNVWAVELVTREVTEFADGAKYIGPWTAVDTKEDTQ